MTDYVYLKKDVPGDRLWEKSPQLAFGIYLVAAILLLFAGMFLMISLDVPAAAISVYAIVLFMATVIQVVSRNRACNQSKNVGFVRRDGVLYQIKLGYAVPIDYQVLGNARDVVLMGPKGAHDAEVACQTADAESELRARRLDPKAYSHALDVILKTNALAAGVMEFAVLRNPEVVRRTKGSMWIAYDTSSGERAISKYRNAYDLDI